MNLLSLLHLGVFAVHVVVCALTLAAVLREHWRLLATRRVDARRLVHTARAAAIGLALLWSTGLTLAALGAAASPSPWMPSAALLAKLLIGGVLTVNGFALHAWVFPWLWGEAPAPRRRPWLAAALGGVSGASWLSAPLLGLAGVVVPGLSFAGFLALYGLALGMCLALALVAMQSWSREAARRVVPAYPVLRSTE
jgi:hypothetical protein